MSEKGSWVKTDYINGTNSDGTWSYGTDETFVYDEEKPKQTKIVRSDKEEKLMKLLAEKLKEVGIFV